MQFLPIFVLIFLASVKKNGSKSGSCIKKNQSMDINEQRICLVQASRGGRFILNCSSQPQSKNCTTSKLLAALIPGL